MVAATVTSCGAKQTPPAVENSPSSSSSVTPSSGESTSTDLPESKPREQVVVGEEIYIADAGIYRGVVFQIEETKDGNIYYLQQVTGANYGAPEMKFLFDKNTKLSYDVLELPENAYLEVYYPVLEEEPTDPTLVQVAIGTNLLQPAAMVNFNGTVKAIDKVAKQITLENIETKQEVVFNFNDEDTKFFVNIDEIKTGDTLNVYHMGMFTASLPPQGSAREVRAFTPLDTQV